MASHPLADAFRSLKEEGKSKVELAVLYKDEGNQWIKKNTENDSKEARACYTHALSLIEEALNESMHGIVHSSHEPTSEQSLAENMLAAQLASVQQKFPNIKPIDTSISSTENSPPQTSLSMSELLTLKSQLYSNRAMAALLLKNYGDCCKDADLAIASQNDNIKAHFRKAKALFMLRRFEFRYKFRILIIDIHMRNIHIPPNSLMACLHGLHIDKTNADLSALKVKCEEEISKLAAQKERANKAQKEVEAKWASAWEIAVSAGVTLGYTESATADALPQLDPLQALPRSVEEGSTTAWGGTSSSGRDTVWPLLFLYPQYGQLDIVQASSAENMLAVHLADMFPEKG